MAAALRQGWGGAGGGPALAALCPVFQVFLGVSSLFLCLHVHEGRFGGVCVCVLCVHEPLWVDVCPWCNCLCAHYERTAGQLRLCS